MKSPIFKKIVFVFFLMGLTAISTPLLSGQTLGIKTGLPAQNTGEKTHEGRASKPVEISADKSVQNPDKKTVDNNGKRSAQALNQISGQGSNKKYESISLFPAGNELGTGWGKKVNVKINWNGPAKILEMDLDGSEFAFGWFQRIFPDTDYSKCVGIYGRYRVPQGTSGRNRISALLVVPEKGMPSEYYSADIGAGSESKGDWVEFYLPVSQFLPSRDARKTAVSSKMLRAGTALEISVSGIEEKSRVEFADFRFLYKEEEKILKRRINRNRIGRFLVPEDQLTGSVHPSLLLTGKRLDRIRAKASEKGVQQDGYNHLIELADQAMKRIDAKDPFKKVFLYSKNSNVNDHVNRGRFEGQMNPLVIPLETLAAAAVITGNEKYGRYAAQALVNMAKTLDVDTPEIDQGFFYTRTFYVRALALGYDWLYHYLTPDDRREVKMTLLGFVQDIYQKSWTAGWGRHPLHRVWNWNPGLVSCAGLGVLAMQGETRTEEDAMLIQFRRHLRDYLTFGIDFDGCCHEGPSYISYGIGAGVPFVECLRNKGYGDLFTETNYQLIAPWLVSEMLPNHPGWNNLSDCNMGQVPGCPVYTYACGRLAELAKTDPVRKGERLPAQSNVLSGLDYIRHFSECPGKRPLSYGALAELMGWAWNTGTNARNPFVFSDAQTLAFVLFYEDCPIAEDPGRYLPDSLFFRGRGLVVSRLGGYNKDAFHLAVEAGPHASGHDQGDKGTFTLRAFGADLVIDSGYGNDGEKEKSGSSYAHNIVLIDGKGQPINWHNDSSGEITGYSHNDKYDWIRTDAKDAWNYRLLNWRKDPTEMNVERADRHYFFVRGSDKEIPPYLIIYDDFRKMDGLEHEYTWQLHTSPEFKFDLKKDRWNIVQNRDGYRVMTTVPEKCSGRAVFELTAPQDGKYNIIGLARAAGADPGKSDSFSFSVNGGKRFCWDLKASSSFSWNIAGDRDAANDLTYDLKQKEKIRVEIFAREPEAQLAFLGLMPTGGLFPDDPKKPDPNTVIMSIDQAVQNAKTPFRTEESITKIINANMIVFPILTSPGKTATANFETSQNGIHPRLTHTVKAVNPEFLMLLIPRADEKTPLPNIRPLKQTGSAGVRLVWPQGRSDTLIFRSSPNGKIPDFIQRQREDAGSR